ncbi:hypothetical protein [Streptomyces pacificus]|uniref:Uncharacterized protein n=1 Tax=Streptomyces pacificus TaxID=2705029 RepID=A0A6A0AYT4_9ACTN|nr:hypothetical protein [Streptomyces pacificus]GFH37491.1 hypothetical protein SCWH03_37290 [Streptomyces pacificus]
MDDSRQAAPGVKTALRKTLPPPALCGFLLLLALVFAGSHALGERVGPVAPGMHATPSGGGADGEGAHGGTGHGGGVGH